VARKDLYTYFHLPIYPTVYSSDHYQSTTHHSLSLSVSYCAVLQIRRDGHGMTLLLTMCEHLPLCYSLMSGEMKEVGYTAGWCEGGTVGRVGCFRCYTPSRSTRMECLLWWP